MLMAARLGPKGRVRVTADTTGELYGNESKKLAPWIFTNVMRL
jgi:hypothetical protein